MVLVGFASLWVWVWGYAQAGAKAEAVAESEADAEAEAEATRGYNLNVNINKSNLTKALAPPSLLLSPPLHLLLYVLPGGGPKSQAPETQSDFTGGPKRCAQTNHKIV